MRLDKSPLITNKLPKATLHTHLEATITPETAEILTKTNGRKFREDLISEEDSNKWHFADKNFLAFLDCYDAVTQQITLEDMETVAYEYLKMCQEKGAIYVEMGISPDHFRADRDNFEAKNKEGNSKLAIKQSIFSEADEDPQQSIYLQYVELAEKAIVRAKKEFGIEARMRVVMVRHEKENCLPLVKEVLANPHPLVVGFDLAGAETLAPGPEFKEEYDLIHEYNKTAKYKLGLGAHAGEHAGPDSIIEAIETLGLQRIGHGVRCMDDESKNPEKHAKTMAKMSKFDVGFEVCTASNVALNLYPSLKDHPLPKLVEEGFTVTLGDDDPVFVGFADIGEEYESVQKTFKFDDATMLQFTANAIDVAFCSTDLKKKLFKQLEIYDQRQLVKQALGSAENINALVKAAHQKYEDNPNEQAIINLLNITKQHSGENKKLVGVIEKLADWHQELIKLDKKVTETLTTRLNDFSSRKDQQDASIIVMVK